MHRQLVHLAISDVLWHTSRCAEQEHRCSSAIDYFSDQCRSLGVRVSRYVENAAERSERHLMCCASRANLKTQLTHLIHQAT